MVDDPVIEEIEDLIDRALTPRQQNLSFETVTCVEAIADLLPFHLPQDKVQEVLNELRIVVTEENQNGSLKDLHSLIKNCTKCPEVEAAPKLPQWNVTNPDIVLVNDTMRLHPEAVESLVAGLKQTGFTSGTKQLISCGNLMQ